MKELETILRSHAVRYPLMEPTDAVKLIYQNEFGGGHLIRDEQTCLARLSREYAQTTKNPDLPLYVDIGNGIVRVQLAAVAEKDLEALGRRFIRSAAAHKGSMARFREKLAVLRRLTGEGVFSFTPEQLQAYLQEYEAQGCPAVSHSPRYRTVYAPAYRIVRKQLPD